MANRPGFSRCVSRRSRSACPCSSAGDGWCCSLGASSSAVKARWRLAPVISAAPIARLSLRALASSHAMGGAARSGAFSLPAQRSVTMGAGHLSLRDPAGVALCAGARIVGSIDWAVLLLRGRFVIADNDWWGRRRAISFAIAACVACVRLLECMRWAVLLGRSCLKLIVLFSRPYAHFCPDEASSAAWAGSRH